MVLALLAVAGAADWAAEVDRARQWETLGHLSGVTPVNGQRIRSRDIHHPDHALARAYLWARLRGIPGLVVREEPFSAEGEDDLANLVAILPGHDAALAPLVVSAHYDSIAIGSAGWDPTTTPAPGADDDASGCAAILELARILSAQPGFERSIELVLFDAEEVGLVGSTHHVANRTGDVHLMVSMDPIGFNPGDAGWLFASVGPDTEAPSAAMDAVADRLDLDTIVRFDVVDAGLIGPPRSDHAPFMEAGHPAMHVGTFPQPTTYHTSEDTLDVVDPGFLADATAIVGATLEELAIPHEPAPTGLCATSKGSAVGLFGALGVLARRRRSRVRSRSVGSRSVSS